MEFDIGLFWKYRLFILEGMWTTIVLSVVAQSLAFAIAVPVAVARLSARFPLRQLANAYVEFIRGTPVLVQLFWIYFCIPIFTGFEWSPFVGAVVALALNVAAYDAEAIRAGILSVARGQIHAARGLGMSSFTCFRLVVLPQAVRYGLPPLLNNFIGLVLVSALASTIGVAELTYVANKLNAATFQSVVIFTGVGVMYLIISVASSVGVRRFEHSYARRD